MDFFQTKMGAKFYNADVPAIIKALNRLAAADEIANSLKIREMKLNDETFTTVTNVAPHNLKQTLYFSLEDFNTILAELTDGNVAADVDTDIGNGFFYYISENATTTDIDITEKEYIKKKLEKYFNIEIETIHADTFEQTGFWIVYKEIF